MAATIPRSNGMALNDDNPCSISPINDPGGWDNPVGPFPAVGNRIVGDGEAVEHIEQEVQGTAQQLSQFHHGGGTHLPLPRHSINQCGCFI